MYTAKCCSNHLADFHNLEGNQYSGIDEQAMSNMIHQVWKDKGMPIGLINREVTTAFAQKFYHAVEKGFGKSLSQLDYDTPDFKMLTALKENTWTFAAAKNYSELRELSDALLDENGKLRSFNDFKTVANSLNQKHIGHYLKAEYEFAVGSSQMASKWVYLQQNPDALLEFDAVLDGQSTELCRSLNGTRLPASHPFWKRYYPLNHFGCRSTVRVVYGGARTAENHIPSADIPAMFQTNLAEGGLVYPAKHSYYKGLPAEILQQLVGKAKLFAKQAIYELPLEEQFTTIYKSKNGGIVKKHQLVLPKPNDPNDDFNDLINAAKAMANEGKKVELLPEINIVEANSRELILSDLKNRSSNPDFRVDNIYMDLKRPGSIERILKNAHKASSHNCEAIILIDNLMESDMERIVNSLKYKKEYTQKNVHFIKGGKLHSYPVNAKGDNSL